MQSTVDETKDTGANFPIVSARVNLGDHGSDLQIGEPIKPDATVPEIARALGFVEFEQHNYIVYTN